jgi:hypothetical protein
MDGSRQPALIPDNVAIHALMQTLRVPENPSTTDLDRLRARIGRVGLGEADFAILVRELGVLDSHAMDQQTRIEALRPSATNSGTPDIARYMAEQVKLGSLMEDHYRRILAALSREGSMRLEAHLDHVKSRIKIFPTPVMSASID